MPAQSVCAGDRPGPKKQVSSSRGHMKGVVWMSVGWDKRLFAITLFVADLERAKAFYRRAFDLEPLGEDDTGATLRLGDIYVRLSASTEAPVLIAPATVGKPDDGPRQVFGMVVDDVDAVAAELTAKGIALLNGPEDRPWGMRIACFQDPDGNVWNVSSDIPD